MILDATELPVVGTDHEHLTVDFKSNLPNRASFELAKDVAAFANAAGGTLLHRAHEDGNRRVVGRYEPMTAQEAGLTINAYDQSIRDRCFPPPSWTSSRINRDGGVVVAINVQPFPGQVVGVKINGDSADGHGGAAYVFPVRVGTQTRFLQPGELAMYMVPEVRMTIVALESISEKERQRVCLIRVGALGTRDMPKNDARIVAVEPERNALRFDNNTSYPLNRVRAVWHNGTQWCISVEVTDLA